MTGTKQCPKCGEVKALTEFSRNRKTRDGRTHWCYPCNREALYRWRAANPERVREIDRRSREADPVRTRLRNRRAQVRPKAIVLAHYGEECACCGATENLSIDHINGGGEEHRRQLGLVAGGAMFYRWLIREDFPPGYQTLCMPCNSSKGDGERCRLDHTNGNSGGPAPPGPPLIAMTPAAAKEAEVASTLQRRADGA